MKSKEYSLAFQGKPVDANFVATILEQNGIESILKIDMMGQLFPLFVFSGRLDPVKVFVFKSDLKKSKEIIAGYFEQ